MASNREESKRLIKIQDQKLEVIKRLNSLSDSEHTWIAYCLYKEVQTLHATQINPTANALLAKGLVISGAGSIMALPFTIQDFVWEHLLNYKEHFLPRDVERDPNVIRNLESFAKNLQRVV